MHGEFLLDIESLDSGKGRKFSANLAGQSGGAGACSVSVKGLEESKLRYRV